MKILVESIIGYGMLTFYAFCLIGGIIVTIRNNQTRKNNY